MSKRNRIREEARQQANVSAPPRVGLKLGDHQFPAFDGLSAAFGARLKDYPRFEDIPNEFCRHDSRFNKAASSLFFKGGILAEHGLRLKAGVDRAEFFTTLQALLASFDPKHEHKKATCAWLLAEYTEPVKAEAPHA